MAAPTPGGGGGSPTRRRRRGVPAEVARDHIYRRLEELGRTILSGDAAAREEARKERSYLEGQLARAQVEARGTVLLDTGLEAAIREETSAGVAAGGRRRGITESTPDGALADGRSDRPPYWERCEKMTFSGLLRFIDESLGYLRKLPKGEHAPESDTSPPRTREEFAALLGLLRAKAGGRALSSRGSDPLPAAQLPERVPFVPSRKLHKLWAEQERVAADHAKAMLDQTSHGRVVRLLARRRMALRKRAEEIEAQERGEHDREHEARLGRYERAEARARARAEKSRQSPGNTGARSGASRKKGRKAADKGLKERLAEVERARREVERAFRSPAGNTMGHKLAKTRRLPWRLLPPGELTREAVMAHYRRLGRARPDIRFDPHRIEKAWSLGPSGCYVGEDEFNGYVVFTYPRTSKALLECPVYGHAIYVLGPDWERLSRLSKRELLADRARGVTKIVHKGNWFARTKAALGLR